MDSQPNPENPKPRKRFFHRSKDTTKDNTTGDSNASETSRDLSSYEMKPENPKPMKRFEKNKDIQKDNSAPEQKKEPRKKFPYRRKDTTKDNATGDSNASETLQDLSSYELKSDNLKPENPKPMKRSKKNKEKQNDNSTEEIAAPEQKKEPTPYKYGPLPKLSGHRIFSRGIIIVGVLIYVWYFSKGGKGGKETVLAKHGNIYNGRGLHVDCDPSYLEEVQQYKGCEPKKCGRFVSDQIVTEYEADVLLWLAKRGMGIAGSSGGASIMDLHSGALSYKDKFINFYKSVKAGFITPTDLKIYKMVRQKVQVAIAETFGLDVNEIYLTHPTFFSRLTNKEPVTEHDEYWHVHVDKHTYETFHYTSLLYLNDYGQDFKGGRFIYLDRYDSPRANVSVEPRKGRVSMFTSGGENPHFVERVTEGERYAITISFTCDDTKQINDPELRDKMQ